MIDDDIDGRADEALDLAYDAWVEEIERLAMLEAEALEYGDEDYGYDSYWDEE